MAPDTNSDQGPNDVREVVLRGVSMPFRTTVGVMLKWWLAAIVAGLIFGLPFVVVAALFGHPQFLEFLTGPPLR